MLLRLANNTQAVTYNNLIRDDMALIDNANNREYIKDKRIRRLYASMYVGLVDGNGATRIVEEIVRVLG